MNEPKAGGRGGARLAAIVFGLGATLILASCASFALAVLDLRHDPTVRVLWLWTGRFWTAFIGAVPFLLFAASCIALYYLAAWAHAHASLVYHKHGLLPAVASSRVQIVAENRNERAEHLQAIFDGRADRINAGAMKNALANPEPLPELMPPPQLPERADVYQLPRPAEPALLLGAGTDGQPITAPLADGGHVLIAGSPRRGKTNWIAAAIAYIATADPAGRRVQIALADLKRVDFAGLPDTLALLRYPIARDRDTALDMLEDVDREMDARLQALTFAGAATIETYNQQHAPMPRLLLIIDEIAELSYLNPDETARQRFNELTQHIGSLGSATGIMLIMATQRPCREVLSRSITGICDTRLAFRCATRIESDLIVGVTGAEALPDVRGRCLIRTDHIFEAQAYNAGVKEGRFRSFMQSLPTAGATIATDWPTTSQPFQQLQPAQPATTALYPATVAPVGAFGIPRLIDRRPPTAEEAAAMRAAHQRGASMTRLCKEAWGYKDGSESEPVWSWMKDALEGRL